MRWSCFLPVRPRGFSLIESAIVLGIIGLVIGGIWAAAASVMNNNKINDALALIARAHETALTFQKTANTTPTSIVPVLAAGSVPGNYTVYGTALTTGRQWFSASVALLSGMPVMLGLYSLDAPNLLSVSARPKMDLCPALSNRLMDARLGTPPGGYASLTWYQADFTPIATWNYGAARLDFSTLTSHCNTATYLYFSWSL